MSLLLLTGGAGFIGSHLVRRILRTRPNDRVRVFDLYTYAASPDSLRHFEHDPRLEIVRGDVADPDALRPALDGAAAVLHLAAESHVDRAIRAPADFVRTNTLGTQTLIDAVLDRPAADRPRLVHVSTDEVYGALPLRPPDLRFTEDTPLAPRNPYAASKAAADLLVRAAHHTHALDAVVLRPANNFGPYQHPEKLIPRFITTLLRGGRVPLYGDGLHVRDWIHADDTAAALLAALDHAPPGRVYNIAADIQLPNIELTRRLLGLTGRDESAIEHVPDRPGHDRRYASDPARARAELRWAPARTDFDDALEETVRWYREHESWWAPLLAAAGR